MRMVPALALMLSLFLAPMVFSDAVYGDQKFPEKYVPDRLLIKFKKDVTNSHQNKLLDDNDGSVIAEIKPLDIKIIKVPEHALEKVQTALSKNSNVEFVEKDYLLDPLAIPNDPNFSNQWHLQTINAPEAWDITQGNSIPIAILDTGVDPNHPDLQDKLINGYNFYNNNADWSDVCGHGTAVAGSAAAITNNGVGVSGVAWNNPIIPIRISDTNCYGYYSSMINGIVYAADNGARVANISFQIFNGAALNTAAQYMNNHGGWVVAAAGNTGAFEDYSENPYIISVSATGTSDSITSWSSYGPYVDFAAPGSSIYTTRDGGSYGYSSGTSFSSPIFAGVVALVLSSDPSMTAEQAYDALKNSAVDKGSAGWDNMYGWGLVDVYSAVSQNNSPPIDSIPPTVTITSPQNGAQVSNIFSVSVDSSDNVEVNVIELYLDGTLYDQKTSVPYEFTLDANTLSEGNHEIKAVSIDTSGNSNFNSITVNVAGNSSDTTPPSVSVIDPSDGSTIEGMTGVSVDATDDVAISSVELFVNGILHDTKFTSPYDFTINADDLPVSTNILMAKAYDSSNNSNEDSINVQVQVSNLPPSISITNPSNGAEVNGRVTITAQTSNFATTPIVQFFVDGIQKEIDISPPYEYGWHTKGETAGSHTIRVEATDSIGNTASSSASVQIAEKGNAKDDSPGPPGKGKKNQEADLIVEVSLAELSEDFNEQSILSAAVPVYDELIGDQTVPEGDILSIDISATDADGHNLSYPESEQVLPTFAVLTDNEDGTASLDISPGFEDSGVYQITITVTDDDEPPSSSLNSFELTVTETSSAPVLFLIDSESTNEGLSISVPFFATDFNPDDALSFSGTNLPSFVDIVDNGDRTGSLEISPSFEDSGEYEITIIVSDNSEPEALTDSVIFTLEVLESTPGSVILYLQNQIPLLESEDIKNLGEKVSFAAKLHVHLVGATKQERSEFQNAFHDYINEAKSILSIGNGMENKLAIQDISKNELKIDMKFEKIKNQEENNDKVKESFLLKEKKAELAKTTSQIISIEHFIKRGDERDKKLADLEAKKLTLIKEITVEEIRQSNQNLSEDELSEIEEKIDQTVESKSSTQGNDNNNGKGSGAKDNNSNKGKSNDKGNKGGNGKSKK